MNDLILNLITAYLPKAIESFWILVCFIWKYLISPIARLFFFPFKRIYRNKRKHIKEFKVYEVRGREHETLIALYYYVFHNSYLPSAEETKKKNQADEYYKKRKPIIF